MIGLIGNEFITIYTPGRGVFDWNGLHKTYLEDQYLEGSWELLQVQVL